MAIDNIGDSVGKKIVEALKIQEESDNSDFVQEIKTEVLPESDDAFDDIQASSSSSDDVILNNSAASDVNANAEDIFQQNLNNTLGTNRNIYSIQSDVDFPANVAILNKLIAKLPIGVSRQTGALIIRQTMEALGISMQSVIQEAKQVQENLSHKAAECQQNIIDYKKQIGTLELQSAQYQRQAVAMNDIINLFVNSSHI